MMLLVKLICKSRDEVSAFAYYNNENCILCFAKITFVIPGSQIPNSILTVREEEGGKLC